MMEERAKRLERVVTDLLCEIFSPDMIDKVQVRTGLDSDGDSVLKIVVALNSEKTASLDAKKMVGVVRHLRSRLEEEDFYDFPLITYVSGQEAGQFFEAV